MTTRADKADQIRRTILHHWRTHSDRQLAEITHGTPTTIGKYRRELEDKGLILPRFENGHPSSPCLRDVSIFAIKSPEENDKVYDPVDETTAEFRAFMDDIRIHGIINPPGVSADGYVFDGNRRYAAAKALGHKRIRISIRPDVSRTKDPDGFLRLLRSCNHQRVKTTAEMLRENIIDMEPDTWHRVYDYRQAVSEINGAEIFALVGEKVRSEIVQKRGLADAIVTVTNDYYERYGATNDRKIFYLLLNVVGLVRNDVTKVPFDNTDECYQDVTNLLTRLRLAGSIPFEAIEDETRPVTIWDAHRNVSAFIAQEMDDFLCGYYRDLLQSQPNWVELLVEKNTVASVLRKTAAKYRLTMTSGRGYSSLPPRKKMVDRFRASGREKMVVIVVSDFDPEGQDIANSFGLSLRDDFGVRPEQLVIVKAALTHRQTQELDLHEGKLGKTEGSRYQRFLDAYGPRVWELEAVPNETLCEIVDHTIQGVLDMDLFRAEVEKEREEQGELDFHRQRVIDAMMTR